MRNLDHVAKLGALIVFREQVSAGVAREPTLRTEADLIERHVFRRLLDPAFDAILRFDCPAASQEGMSTMRRLPLGTNRKGVKVARARVVILEKKPSTFSSLNIASATGSYPPSAWPRLSELPRQRWTVIFMSRGRSAIAPLIRRA